MFSCNYIRPGMELVFSHDRVSDKRWYVVQATEYSDRVEIYCQKERPSDGKMVEQTVIVYK